MKYFVVMIDYGRDVTKAHGMEAIIRPENTRRQIIRQVRDVLDSDDLSLVHVKFIDGNFCCDVSEEIIAEASTEADLPDWEDLRGRAPNATGGLSSEAFVRELRNGWR